MRKYLSKVTIAATFSLLGLTIGHSEATAASLFIGRYGSFAPDINFINFIPQNKTAKQITDGSNKLNTSQQRQLEKKDLIAKIDALGSAEPIKEQIEKEHSSFTNESDKSIITSEERSLDSNDLTGIANPDEINQNIEDRYYSLVETDEKISLFENNKLTENIIASKDIHTKYTDEALNNTLEASNLEQDLLPKYFTAGVYFAVIGSGFILFVPIIYAFGSSENSSIFAFLNRNYGKENIPESTVTLHNKTLKEIASIARKVERIDSEKFTNKEFVLYVKLKKQLEQNLQDSQRIYQSIKYLEVAIYAQSSYLRIEQTELRYRSRKQQEFYNFILDSIADGTNKNDFRERAKRKLAEILPLIQTEEGRNALKEYLKEIEKISKHDLGLKLLSLFKKYQLTDFNVLRKVSELVDRVNAQDLLEDKNIMALVLENYNVLEKLAPIIQINQNDIKPDFFVKILRYMGLVRRHEKAFQQFQELIKVLKKWQKPFNYLNTIRQQYSGDRYKRPKEFSEKIPGVNTYKKYEEYINKQQ